MINFDSFYEELGVPELKGFLDEPPPEPVDKSLLEKFAVDEVDAETELRLCHLVANYRSWAEAYRAVLLRIHRPGRSSAAAVPQSRQLAPLVAVLAALAATVLLLVRVPDQGGIEPASEMSILPSVYQRRSPDPVLQPDDSYVVEAGSNLQIRVVSPDAGKAVAVTLFKGEANVHEQVIDVPRRLVSPKAIRIPTYSSDFDLIVFVTSDDSLNRIISVVDTQTEWTNADEIIAQVEIALKADGAGRIHTCHHVFRVVELLSRNDPPSGILPRVITMPAPTVAATTSPATPATWIQNQTRSP